MAANVDQVVIVFAAARPDPHPRMLDRFLVIAEANGLAARIVVNKVDLTELDATHARFADYPRAGYPVHFTSARRGTDWTCCGAHWRRAPQCSRGPAAPASRPS